LAKSDGERKISAPVLLRLRGRLLEPHTWLYWLFKIIRFANLWGIIGDVCILVVFVDTRLAAAASAHGTVPAYIWVVLAAYATARIGHVIYGESKYIDDWNQFEDDIRPHLAELHSALFGDYAGVRYTLFMPDDFSPEWLVARARFEYGLPHERASHSRVRYARNMGYTGLAWSLPTPDESDGLFDEFPDFPPGKEGRKNLRDYYQKQLQVPPAVARSVSAYMSGVKKLYGIRLPSGSHGLEDCGVLSVDVTKDTAQRLDANGAWPTANRFSTAIGDELMKYLRAHIRIRSGRRRD
jgi:hypothetical protein